MTRKVPLLALALALTAQASTAAPRQGAPVAGPSCIDTDRIVSRTATAPNVLAIELSGGRRVALNLADPCPHLAGIDRTYTIVFDQIDGGRLCRGSRFRVVDPLLARSGGIASFPFCRIRSFTDLPRTPPRTGRHREP